jgi:hypothetical protein
MCNNLQSLNGDSISWVSTCRYLGVYLTASRRFKCDFGNSKKSFIRSVNAILGKILRIASEETVLYLISRKCMPILLFGLDACPVTAADKHSFDFVLTRLLMKIFRTGSVHIVSECRSMFGMKTISEMVTDCKRRFFDKSCG